MLLLHFSSIMLESMKHGVKQKCLRTLMFVWDRDEKGRRDKPT